MSRNGGKKKQKREEKKTEKKRTEISTLCATSILCICQASSETHRSFFFFFCLLLLLLPALSLSLFVPPLAPPPPLFGVNVVRTIFLFIFYYPLLSTCNGNNWECGGENRATKHVLTEGNLACFQRCQPFQNMFCPTCRTFGNISALILF